MTTAVEEALATTTTVPLRHKSAIEAEHKRVCAEQATLLPVERQYSVALDKRKAELAEELAIVTTFPDSKETLPLLSQDVLDWRHPRGIMGVPVPRLALISLTGATSSMQFKSDEYKKREVNVAPVFGRRYGDVLEQLCRLDRVRSESLTWTFKGVIPTDTRAKIRAHRGQFEDTLLLAEAPLATWTHERNRETFTERRRRVLAEMRERWALDPIVCGLAGGRLWVIDVFDPSPIEEYILSEFTTKALPPA